MPTDEALPSCEINGCTDRATVELHIPWKENELVCAGHARVKVGQEGVVAAVLPDAEDEFPNGAAFRQ